MNTWEKSNDFFFLLQIQKVDEMENQIPIWISQAERKHGQKDFKLNSQTW